MGQLARYARPALAAALALLLAALWLLPGPAAAPWQGPAMLAQATQDAADSMISQWGGTALARPLFSPARRPAGQPGAAADGGLPRLSAIILVGGAGMAVFAPNGQKPVAISQGGTIGGYVVERVAQDHVELAAPGGTLSLRPQFAGGAAPASPPAGPPGGQIAEPLLNPSSNPAINIEQNF